MRIVDYQIVSSTQVSALVGKVAELIEEDWQPFGGVAMHRNAVSQIPEYAQVMVRYEEE